MSWPKESTPSRWREFMYVFHELQRIVVPVLPLPDILSNWTYVSLGLADRPRRRKIQVSKYFPKWETS